MTGARTVTVRTLDHGPVTLTCPTWCTGPHEDDTHRADQAHEGREHVFAVPTHRGPLTLLLAMVEQRPFTELPFPGPGVFVNVEIGGDWYPSNPAQLDAMAAALVEHAGALRALSRELAVLQARGER